MLTLCRFDIEIVGNIIILTLVTTMPMSAFTHVYNLTIRNIVGQLCSWTGTCSSCNKETWWSGCNKYTQLYSIVFQANLIFTTIGDVCKWVFTNMSFSSRADAIRQRSSQKSQVIFAFVFSWIGDLFVFFGLICVKLRRVCVFSV